MTRTTTKKTAQRNLAAALLLLVTSCSPIYADGPYHGRVIDAETKQPIEGAAVLAVWWQQTPMIGHPIESVHDALETLTDAEGNFTIAGTFKLSLISKIDAPRFTIFKPGYQAYNGPLRPIPLVGIQTPGVRPYEKDGRTVWELQSLDTRKKRLENLGRISISSRVPEDKYPNLIKLRDIEEKILGLTPRRPKKGEGQ